MKFSISLNRRDSGSIKWNRYPESVIPMWVADMDFEAAEPIQSAILKYKDSLVYGYAAPRQDLAAVLVERLKSKYNWDIDLDWIVWLPAILPGIVNTARSISASPYGVMTSVPVYHPFIEIANSDNRFLQAVPLTADFKMDFEAMRAAVTEETKLYILSNPHNPTGRMYTKEELLELGNFCNEHKILLCSDEIHADIVIDPSRQHIPVASVSRDIALNSVSLFSPGKAFNIPGISGAFAVIPDDSLRAKFRKTMLNAIPHLGKFGADIMHAAYVESNEWQEESLRYLRQNHDYLLEQINKIEGLEMQACEATYLAWINFSALGDVDFVSHLEKHGVGVIDAKVFMGTKYFRLNFATQKELLEEAVTRIKNATASLKS